MRKNKDKKSKKNENKVLKQTPAPTPEHTPTPAPAPGVTEFQVPGVRYKSSRKNDWLNAGLYILSLGAVILAAYLVKEWVIALLAKETVVSNAGKVVKFFKGKDP